MRISTKLRVGYLFSAFIVIFAGSIIFLSFKKTRSTSRKLKLVEAITQGVFELNLLGSEFLLYKEGRPKIQWQIKFNTLSRLLEKANFHNTNNQNLFIKIREDLEHIRVLFSDFVFRQSTTGDSFENEHSRQFQNRLQSQLLLKSQRVFLQTTKLKKQIENEFYSIQNYTSLLSIMLIMASALMLVVIGFLINKSITSPLKTLMRGIETVGSGNLEFHLETDRNDEIGQLSKSFHQMVDNINTVMVSHNELERKIEERTAELVASNRLLSLEIKERKNAGKKLKVAEQKYRTVADYTYDWEYWANVDGTLEYVSPSCERISGYSPQDFISNPSFSRDIIVPEDRDLWDEHNRSLHKELKPDEIQFRIRRQDGEIRWIEHACQPVSDDQSNPLGFRASNRDITERKNYETETLRLQSELAHIDMVSKIGTLTSALAHEINQPLAAMRSYAQAALRFLNADQPEYDNLRKALQGIVADNKRAASVINHLRSLMKKEKHSVKAFDVNSLIERVLLLLNSEIVLRNAKVKLNLHADALTFYGDLVQIQQVLMNLLTNALDAIDDQPVKARHVTLSTKTKKAGDVIVSISDSGGGIDPDKMEKIFNPFYTTKSQGLGLGLAICRSIIEVHGGQLDCENNPGGGATFWFMLPYSSKLQSSNNK